MDSEPLPGCRSGNVNAPLGEDQRGRLTAHRCQRTKDPARREYETPVALLLLVNKNLLTKFFQIGVF